MSLNFTIESIITNQLIQKKSKYSFLVHSNKNFDLSVFIDLLIKKSKSELVNENIPLICVLTSNELKFYANTNTILYNCIENSEQLKKFLNNIKFRNLILYNKINNKKIPTTLILIDSDIVENYLFSDQVIFEIFKDIFYNDICYFIQFAIFSNDTNIIKIIKNMSELINIYKILLL